MYTTVISERIKIFLRLFQRREIFPPPPPFFPPYSSRFFNSLVSSIIVHDSLRSSVQRELLHILM